MIIHLELDATTFFNYLCGWLMLMKKISK
jgi:hypothetical protein